ncbi:MAG: lipase [Leptospiraceae bacterium]|nr:lipase [Leptospiraceae bacterium]MCP5512368.1 lipase [Leptospiraceae bacterium]
MKTLAKILLTTIFSLLITTSVSASGGSSTPPLQGSHPYILIHGILGFDDKNPPASILTYWGGMDDYLKSKGAKVISPGSQAMASISTRAGQTVPQIIDFMNSVGATKVHLLGHSQGGLVSRYIASHSSSLYGKISTVTTLNAVHRGSPVADIGLGVIPDWLEPFVGTVVNWFGNLMYSSNQQDVLAMANSLTSKTLATFNTTVPNKSGVKYFSYGSKMTILDLIQHPIMGITYPICWTGGVFNGQGGENDGVVPLTSQKWGTWKGGPSYGLLVTGVDHLQATNFEWTGQLWYDVEEYFLNMAKNAKSNQ